MLRRGLITLGCASFLAINGASAWSQDKDSSQAALFATVNSTRILSADFDLNAREAFRRKYYHGTPPEAEVNAMLREVGQAMIDQVLIDAEAKARGIIADPSAVAAGIAQMDLRNNNNPQWASQRPDVLAELTALLEQKSRQDLLTKLIRTASPTPNEVDEFYRANPALFTEPRQNKVSLIMIGVDPSSPSEAWEQAREKAIAIRGRLRNGEDFALLAKEFSTGPSAESGGDLSSLHQGRLGQQTEVELEKLQPGMITEPYRTLEGFAIVRLDARTPERFQPFEAVATRARELLTKQQAEVRWANFLKELRAKANIVIGPAFETIMTPPEPPASAPR